MNFDVIEEMNAKFKAEGLRVYAVSAIIDGEQRDYRLIPDNNCKNMYSMSKAFTMTAAGMLYDDGLLAVSETMLDVFGDESLFSEEPKWRDVTIDNALTHKTGITRGYLDIDEDNVDAYGTKDYLGIVFNHKIEGVTGETYQYSDAAYYLLSRVVSKKCGKSVCDYLLDRLFNPMNFREVAWSVCPYGYNIGASGLYIRSDDAVKLAQLYLEKGVCNGKRLLSEEWVDIAIERGYAFTTVLEEKRGYQKTGANGQKLYFSFNDKLALAIQSFDSSEKIGNVMMEFLKN